MATMMMITADGQIQGEQQISRKVGIGMIIRIRIPITPMARMISARLVNLASMELYYPQFS